MFTRIRRTVLGVGLVAATATLTGCTPSVEGTVGIAVGPAGTYEALAVACPGEQAIDRAVLKGPAGIRDWTFPSQRSTTWPLDGFDPAHGQLGGPARPTPSAAHHAAPSSGQETSPPTPTYELWGWGGKGADETVSSTLWFTPEEILSVPAGSVLLLASGAGRIVVDRADFAAAACGKPVAVRTTLPPPPPARP